MTKTITKERVTISVTKALPEFYWKTILFNCYCHEQEEVRDQLMKALGCSSSKAGQLIQVIETFGSATVYQGTEIEYERVCNVLGSIGLDVKVSQ